MFIRRLVGAVLAAATVSAVMAAAPVHAATGDISTIAGTNTAGYSGDDGLATAAKLNHPYSMHVDSSGNVYLADYDNHVVRKITAATGIITTIAGTGVLGYSGDDGLATAATLNYPNDVAVDSSGNVYIADGDNNVVRKITAATGIITTIAGTGVLGYSGDGGLATAATMRYAASVNLDSSGNLYISDYNNSVIRKVTAATGIITTIAGTGTAGNSGDGGLATAALINGPQDAAVDAAGNVYISDYGASVIRKVTAATGIITTIAGTGTAGYSGDGGLATAAQIAGPGFVALDAARNLYFADYSNNRVRKITAATGIITTIAGTGTAGYSGDGGPAVNAKLDGPYGLALRGSSLYIGDYTNHVVRKVSLPRVTLPPTGANATALVWLAAAMFTAGAALVATRRRAAL